MFRGKFYDNVHSQRKGVTALSWPKPKLKFKAKKQVWGALWRCGGAPRLDDSG